MATDGGRENILKRVLIHVGGFNMNIFCYRRTVGDLTVCVSTGEVLREKLVLPP